MLESTVRMHSTSICTQNTVCGSMYEYVRMCLLKCVYMYMKLMQSGIWMNVYFNFNLDLLHITSL